MDANNPNLGWHLETFSVVNGQTSVSTVALLTIVASKDDTNVKVYNLETDELIFQDTIDDMERCYITLANGTVFKVVSDSPVSVLLLNMNGPPHAGADQGPLPDAYYQSVDGLYVGKKFVFMSSVGLSNPDYRLVGKEFMLFALERSKITVTRDDDNQKEYSMEANSYLTLMLESFRVFKIESTGNIMVYSGIIEGRDVSNPINCFYVPSAEGGFIGKVFYARGPKIGRYSWDGERDYGYRISAITDAKVTVFDLETKQVITELTLKGGSGIKINPTAEAIAVQSNVPILFHMIHNGSIGRANDYGIGVTFIGVRPNEDTPLYLPSHANVEAFFFASEETDINIDDSSIRLPANSYYLYNLPGPHVIRSDKNIIIQVNHWPLEPENQGLRFSGAVIPCIQTVNYIPDVTLTPIGEPLPIFQIIIGVIAASIGAVTIFLLRKKRQ
ncbi:MAG: hypothetical protein QXZ70_02635 [Candidatus Bathyarchaeia archaeon]